MRVDQVIPDLAWPDAVGMHTLGISDALRAEGIDSDIYYGSCATPAISHRGHPLSHLGRTKRDRFLLYQSSIGSPVADLVADRSEPVLVNYHNITPTPLVDHWEPRIGVDLELGRMQLRRLAERCCLGIADSEYNRRELEESGYHRSAVVPLLIEMNGRGHEPDRPLLERLDEEKAKGGVDLLFVGKVAPHKAPHDLVKMTAVYRKLYNDRVRLHLVGSPLGGRYGNAISDFISSLGLNRNVDITGSVNAAMLESYYQRADVFVCASEHEGFCVPIVEAMAHGVPVVASTAGPYGAGAVPETVSSAGLLLDTKNPARFAAAVHRVVQDQGLQDRLRQAGLERANDFSIQSSTGKMVRLIKSILN